MRRYSGWTEGNNKKKKKKMKKKSLSGEQNSVIQLTNESLGPNKKTTR